MAVNFFWNIVCMLHRQFCTGLSQKLESKDLEKVTFDLINLFHLKVGHD